MFGYVTANYKALSEEDRAQYRQYYCGLCRALKQRYGNLSRLTLNNDMTFLFLLLSSLYEPEEDTAAVRCVLHPSKRMQYVVSDQAAYCADMTVLLAYLEPSVPAGQAHRLLDLDAGRLADLLDAALADEA